MEVGLVAQSWWGGVVPCSKWRNSVAWLFGGGHWFGPGGDCGLDPGGRGMESMQHGVLELQGC